MARAHKIGIWSEHFACLWLWCRGYRVLHRRWRFRGGEIDIIARKGHFLLFIEVKHRPHMGWASEAITRHQQRRLIQGSYVFLSRHPKLSTYQQRFDAILIAPGQWPVHIYNAFGAK